MRLDAGTLEMKDAKPIRLRAGSYALLPGRQIHQATCYTNCVFFNTADAFFDIHYVDDREQRSQRVGVVGTIDRKIV